MFLFKLANILILLFIVAGCAKDRILYRDRVEYRDKPCSNTSSSRKTECLASCRKELVDLLGKCYRDNKNFVYNHQTMSGRSQYLNKVKDCISTGKFSKYQPGVEMCEGICR